MEKQELQTLRLWNPLFPKIYRKNEWGDTEYEPEDMEANEIVEYQEEILAAIEREKLSNEGERGLAVYLDNDVLKGKVYSINPIVEEWDGKLWGVTEVQSHGELTQAELDEVISELTGQFSDGWGEGFEQRAIDTPYGELYLSFWDAGNGFFIKPEEELKNQQSQGFGMTMG